MPKKKRKTRSNESQSTVSGEAARAEQARVDAFIEAEARRNGVHPNVIRKMIRAGALRITVHHHRGAGDRDRPRDLHRWRGRARLLP